LERIDLHWYNAGMQKYKHSWVIIVSLILAVWLLSACSPGTVSDPTAFTNTAASTLRPYPSGTATSTALPTGFSSPTPSPTLTSTPTQVYYEIQLGDDMYSIGWRFGVSPQAIMTANPSINPNLMIVGTELLIPITPTPEPTESQQSEISPQPTQAQFTLLEPACYPESLGGLWCFILVENDTEEAFENISAMLTLQQGVETRQKVAIMPLNLLPAGKSLPLVVYFEPPVSPSYTIAAEVDFYLPVMADDDRYLETEIEDLAIEYRDTRKVAQVSGELRLLPGQPDAAYAWIHATAFDDQENVVAVRRWTLNEMFKPETSQLFTLNLYSLAGEIERVELLVEAHRVFETSSEE
jgi:LysM repeat protein